MENFCKCNIYEQSFNDLSSFFLKTYNKFIKIKGKEIKSKKSFKEMQDNYDVLLSCLDSFSPKAEEVISKIKKCPKNHSEYLEEIKSKVDKENELRDKIRNHYENIKKTIPEIEQEEEEDEKEINKIENINNLNNNKPLEQMSDKEIMENDKQTIIMIQNLLEDKEYKDKLRADKKDIIKIKNQLKDIINEIEVELNKNDEQIDNIEQKVDNSYDLVEKGTDENLRKAAETAISRRRLKYQLGLSVTLGAIGSIIPGIGTLIGAGVGGALGGVIGYGAYRIDKHRLNKIEKKEKEEKKK